MDVNQVDALKHPDNHWHAIHPIATSECNMCRFVFASAHYNTYDYVRASGGGNGGDDDGRERRNVVTDTRALMEKASKSFRRG